MQLEKAREKQQQEVERKQQEKEKVFKKHTHAVKKNLKKEKITDL